MRWVRIEPQDNETAWLLVYKDTDGTGSERAFGAPERALEFAKSLGIECAPVTAMIGPNYYYGETDS